jgi:hypothetical protein
LTSIPFSLPLTLGISDIYYCKSFMRRSENIPALLKIGENERRATVASALKGLQKIIIMVTRAGHLLFWAFTLALLRSLMKPLRWRFCALFWALNFALLPRSWLFHASNFALLFSSRAPGFIWRFRFPFALSVLLCIFPSASRMSLLLYFSPLSLHRCLFPSVSPPLSLLLCLFPLTHPSVSSPLSLPLCLFPSFSSLCLFPSVCSPLSVPLCLIPLPLICFSSYVSFLCL